jgi:CRISPR-associated endoribonuclease Cas6
VLFARIRDRISTLCSLYGEEPLSIDFAALGERANRVRTLSCDLDHHDVSRRSSRTGDVHGIGGFTGTMEYEGDMAEFLPYLRAAWWTGAGRHTVWGNGVIEVDVLG